MAYKIKKDDEVQIMTGKDRGERGKVLEVLADKNRVVIEGLNLVKRHQKEGQGREGGIMEQEASVHMSNVMLVDPTDDKPTRVGFVVKDGAKHRITKRTQHLLD